MNCGNIVSSERRQTQNITYYVSFRGCQGLVGAEEMGTDCKWVQVCFYRRANVLKFVVVMVAHPCEYSILNRWIIH